MNKKPDKRSSEFSRMDTGEKILFRSSAFRVPESKTREAALEELNRKIAEREKILVSPAQSKNTRLITWISSAAALMLILIAIRVLHPGKTNVAAGMGRHLQYTLPDGSDIKLNADTKITFSKNDFNNERKLRMEGEAFFNVSKGSAFRIMTKNGEIEVLGTSFNVYSREKSFSVACYSGRVKVTSGQQSLIIEPGESTDLTGGNLKLYKDSRMNYIKGWLNGEFYFENSPLRVVFAEVERQFNVKFVTRIKEDKLFYTGGFTNKDLDEALESICLPMNLNYEVGANKRISIKSRK